IVRSPVDICLGTRPSQAAKSRPLENTAPAPIAATIALQIRPDTGYADQPLATCVQARDGFDLVRQTLNALVEPAPVPSQIFDDAHHARRQRVRRSSEDARQLGTQESQTLPTSNTTFQQTDT